MLRRRIGFGRACLALASLYLAFGAIAASPAHADPRLQRTLMVWGYTAGSTFNQPRGVTFDPKDGAIYVANTGEHRIEIFSKSGRPLARFVHRVSGQSGERVDGRPVTLAFDRSGRLLVVDQLATYVDVLDRRGRHVARLDVPAGHPNAVAVGPDGAIYVGTATETAKIYRFRPDYAADGAWGEQGAAPGHLTNVGALAVLADGTVAVACAQTDLVVQLFSPAGQFLRGFGSHEVGEGNFSMPSGLAATADGRLWVIDEIRQTVQVFDAQGSFIATAGGRGAAAGEFAHPSSLTSDGGGLLAVADRELGLVQVFAVTLE
jgi:DNA-binding beta-propeller fold protein YncE